MAQIGVLKALEEAGFEIAAIAGTSIGGIIGGLYAAGYEAEELEKIVESINFVELFSNRPPRTTMFTTQRPEKDRFLASVRFDGWKPSIPRALTAGQKLSALLIKLTLQANYISGGDFSRLKVPFRAITTDIVSGREVVLSKGNLADAMRATMAFPLAFTGVEKDEMLLMDGGIVDPMPVEVVRDIDRRLDMVIAVNTASELLPREEIANPVDIANQVTSIMAMDKLEAGLEAADLVITPDIEAYLSTDFKEAAALVERGYRAGREAVGKIMDDCNGRHKERFVIAGIEIADDAERLLGQSPPISEGMVVTMNDLRETAGRLYLERDLFTVRFRLATGAVEAGGVRAAELTIEVIEKPLRRNLKVDLEGNSLIGDSVIMAALETDREYLSAEVVVRFTDSVMALYRDRGYDLAHFSGLDYNPETNSLTVKINEPMIENIRLDGNRRTKNWLIKSNFPLHDGDPFNSRAANRGLANIYSTDLFDRVVINVLPGDEGAIVRINVEEKKYTQLRFGWHWDDEYKSEGFVELLDDNLFGTGQEYLMHARYSPRRQNYDISLKADRFFSTYLTYKASGFYRILDRRFYNKDGDEIYSIREDRYGLEFLLGQQIARFGTVTGEIRWEEIKNDYSPGEREDNLRLRTITLRSLVETLNRYPFPTAGKKHLFYVKFAADILGGETRYTKFFSSVESYFPLGDWFNFHPKIAIGYTDSEQGLPISESFFMGGHYSFYGYATDELYGSKMLLGNMEVRFKLPWRLYLSARYDFGEVYPNIDQIKLRNIRHGGGISIACDTPIGPIDIGYGKSGTHPDRLYVDIGLRF